MENNNGQNWRSLEGIRDKYLGKVVSGSRSPAGNWLQFVLEDIQPGTATLAVPVRTEMTNPYGHIHGGMMSLVIDEAIGWAVASLISEHHFTSMNLTVDFLYAIKSGDTLKAVSRVIREGKRIVNCECFVYNSQKVVLAHGTSNLIATNMSFV